MSGDEGGCFGVESGWQCHVGGVRRNEADDMAGIGCRLRARGRWCIGIDLTLYPKLVDWLY
jgi:hypothetical protein